MNDTTDAHAKGKVLILIVAYHAETTIQQVLSRIPDHVFSYDYEILILDDQSTDQTFSAAQSYASQHSHLNLRVLRNPVNQGYGGNQKLGYQYAIDSGADAVVLLHGDGQYAPEMIEDIFLPILKGKADAVFGTRMGAEGDARKGGMPLYKFVGNRILSTFQNACLGLGLTEYHSGYRAYSVAMLKQIPFELNTNEFHFDTEIIIQLWLAKARILEVDIPTYYGDEICRVNGLKYAWDVIRATVGVRLHLLSLRHQRRFDLKGARVHYGFKQGYPSSHSMAISEVPNGSRVLDVGCGDGHVARALIQKGCTVTGVDAHAAVEGLSAYHQTDLASGHLPVSAADYDVILLLDVLEHIPADTAFRLLRTIRREARGGRPRLIISIPNIAFISVRVMLLFGSFAYGRKGILDLTHQHLFTRKSMLSLLREVGMRKIKCKGVPPPYPEAVGLNLLGKLLIYTHQPLARIWPALFGYQLFFSTTPAPDLPELLEDTEG